MLTGEHAAVVYNESASLVSDDSYFSSVDNADDTAANQPTDVSS